MKTSYTLPNHRATLDINPDGYICRIVVQEQERNKGIGTILMAQACADADEECVVLSLHPTTNYGIDIVRLRNFFQRFGFYPEKDGLWVREPECILK